MTGGLPEQVVAVDWSGARDGGGRHIWLARVDVASEALVELCAGRSRDQVCARLLEIAADEPRTVIGLDFAFSLPAWFMRDCGFESVAELWAADDRREAWLSECRAPFWGRPPTWRRPPVAGSVYRRTAEDITERLGVRPKSVFQVGGAGSVGTGSLRGMRTLRMLREGGVSIWPFDPLRLPAVVEIYPRLFTGRTKTAQHAARVTHLKQLGWPGSLDLRERVSSSADAFDAAVSAVSMARLAASLAGLGPAVDDRERLEGRIFAPVGS